MIQKFTRTFVLGLALVAPTAVLAEAPANQRSLSCPTGTKQWGNVKDGLYCRKVGQGMGEQHGPYRSFHANGQVAAEGQYTDGFKTGQWHFFDAEGRKRGEVQFVGSNYHGKRVEYFPTGQTKSVEEYSHGFRHGLVQQFDTSGRVVRQARYEKNVRVKDR